MCRTRTTLCAVTSILLNSLKFAQSTIKQFEAIKEKYDKKSQLAFKTYPLH